MFEGKKIIILGERDEIPDEAIKKCLEAAGVPEENIIYHWTDCFV